jgi:hypothetical protein
MSKLANNSCIFPPACQMPAKRSADQNKLTAKIMCETNRQGALGSVLNAVDFVLNSFSIAAGGTALSK